MRLSTQQIGLLVSALEPFLQNNTGELRLYGSRTSDELKGGDIDLLLILKDNVTAEKLNSEKHYLLAAIKKYLGDQKIDLLISADDSIKEDIFLKMVFPKSVLLKKWRHCEP